MQGSTKTTEGTAAAVGLAAPTSQPVPRQDSEDLPLNKQLCLSLAVDNKTLHKKVWGQPHLQSKLHDYITDLSQVHQEVRDLIDKTMQFSDSVMATTLDQLPVMGLLASLSQSKRIVDIGTYTGISALQFALSVPSDGQVITIDRSNRHLKLATTYWKKAGVADKIEARLGEGLEVLDQLGKDGYLGKVDLAFIDADKLGYNAYYERLLKLVRPGGLIIMDNVFHFSRVVDDKAEGVISQSMRTLNHKLYHDKRISLTLIPSADGLAVCRVQATE